jgi:hypothetical protein
MIEVDTTDVFPIEYVDLNRIERRFFVYPEAVLAPIVVPAGFARHLANARRRDFLVRTAPATPSDGVDRIFQLNLEERTDRWWRVDMIGQTSGYTEFEKCGLPEEVILAVARRFQLRICSSTSAECQVGKARNVWARLRERFEATPGDFMVKEREGRFWLRPTEQPAQEESTA